jgi:uncharacterized membrane protein SirB2
MTKAIFALLALLAIAIFALDSKQISNRTRVAIEWGAFVCFAVVLASLTSFA